MSDAILGALLESALRNPEVTVRALAPRLLPVVADQVVRNYVPPETLAALKRFSEAHAGKRDRFLSALRERQSGVYPIVGAKGSGKTAYAFALAEHLDRPTYAANVAESTLPYWVEAVDVDDVGSLEPGAVVIVDDAGQVASSRDYHSARARALEDLVSVVRHRRLVLISTTTLSNLVHRSLLDGDALFLKPPSLFGVRAERRELRDLLEIAAEAFAEYGGDRRRTIFAVSDDPPFTGLISYDLPRGWSDELSHNKS